jgi:hypothetical protein
VGNLCKASQLSNTFATPAEAGTDNPSALDSAKIPGATIFLAKPFNHRQK